MKFNFLATKFI